VERTPPDGVEVPRRVAKIVLGGPDREVIPSFLMTRLTRATMQGGTEWNEFER